MLLQKSLVAICVGAIFSAPAWAVAEDSILDLQGLGSAIFESVGNSEVALLEGSIDPSSDVLGAALVLLGLIDDSGMVAGPDTLVVAEAPVVAEEIKPEVVSTESVVTEVAEAPVAAMEAKPEIAEAPVAAMEAKPEVAEAPVVAMEVKPEVAEAPVAAMEAKPEVAEAPVAAMEAKPEVAEAPVVAMEVKPEQVSEAKPAAVVSAPSVPEKTKPVASTDKFNLEEKPSGFFSLTETLFESQEDQDKRLGPITRPDQNPDLKPPVVKEYRLADANVEQINAITSRFVRDFELAKKNDPAFQAALYEFEAASISADVAGLAYTPRLAIQNRFLDNESKSRTTVSISQPLFNMQLLATVQEKESRLASAQAQMNLRQYELSERVFEAVILLIEAGEQLRVNTVRIQALETESGGAKREFELGSGSVTDVRDAETRLAQAQAEQLKFQSALRTASRRLFQLTGDRPNPANYTLSRQDRTSPVDAIDAYMAEGLSFNSELLKSRAQERLVELEVLKAKGAYLPSVDLIASRSYSDLGDIKNSGLTFGISVPVNAGTFYEASAAEARLNQARLNTREVQEKIESNLEQAYFNVTSGVAEVKARLQAIESAKLSVTANEKSFKGGVRTRIDVLNSVETLYVVSQQYIRSVAELARNYLKLNNSAAQPVDETMARIQDILF